VFWAAKNRCATCVDRYSLLPLGKRQVPKDQSIFLVLEKKAQHQFCPERQSTVSKQCEVRNKLYNSAPERGKEEKRRDKTSIRESEGDKIVQKDEETDVDGKESEENTIIFGGGQTADTKSKIKDKIRVTKA